MSENPIRYQPEGKVAALRFDDGKANAISHLAIDGLNAALDRAEQEADAARLAELPRRAFSETKERIRGTSAERIRRSVADEMASLGGIV
jgi:hypothetical protein